MKQILQSPLLLAAIIVILGTCHIHNETKNDALYGSWEMKSIQWHTADTTYTIEPAQPGLFMLDKQRYSIMWTPIDQPRIPFDNLASPSKKEILEGFRSIVFNSGSYAIKDSILTTTAHIAKVPGFEGGKQFYTFSIIGKQLHMKLFDETYPDGNKPEWYGKVVTEFVLERVKA